MTESSRGKTGIYIHIPFCVKKCNYCAFLSFDAEGSPRREYADALINEIRLRAAEYGRLKGSAGSAPEIDTVYVGGGTPSVLDMSQLRDIMHAVKTSFRIKPGAEISIEANPGTLGRKDGVTRAKLQAYKYMGFNRLSMGVQSMDNDRLHFLGRIHTAEDVTRDFRLARELGFDNINLDLIFSVPGESAEDALSDAERIIALGPEHISCYSLQIEEGTPFYEAVISGGLSEVPDDEDRETYHRLCALLRGAGYEHYEISNFARMPGRAEGPGFAGAPRTGSDGQAGAGADKKSPYRSRHNSLYWDMSEYIGLGLGASGFAGGIRYKNISGLEEYIRVFGGGAVCSVSGPDVETASGDCGCSGSSFAHVCEEHINSEFDSVSEAVFTGLRRREGITYREALAAAGRCSGTAQSEKASDNNGCSDAARDHEGPDTDAEAREAFGRIFPEHGTEAGRYAAEGLLLMDDEGLRLTERGIDISNSIMSLFV